MEALSPEVFMLLCTSLTGGDVFHLSHVNHHLQQATSLDEIWRQKCNLSSLDGQTGAAKGLWRHRYLSSRSFQTKGCSLAIIPDPMGPRSVLTMKRGLTNPVSVDAWFALAADNELVEVGGILVDFHDSSTSGDQQRRRDIVLEVNSDRRLLFAMDRKVMADTLGPVGPQLKFNRRYHVVVVNFGEESDAKVFLDGECLRTRSVRSMLRVQHDGERERTASRNLNGFPFNGIIDALRVWERPLSAEEVAVLASGSVLHNCNPLISVKETRPTRAKANLVRCTRPWERVAVKF